MDINEYGSLIGSLLPEFRESGAAPEQYFQWAIHKQNSIYELPINLRPTLDGLNETPLKRIQGFMKTLEKEMQEGHEIIAMLKLRDIAYLDDSPCTKWGLPGYHTFFVEQGIEDQKRRHALADVAFEALMNTDGGVEELGRQILVMIADWLGDQNVYLRSEALKFGIPHEAVLNVIMGSNFTKLDENGNPIKDENGKFLKGPNYMAPERHIYATLFGLDDLVDEHSASVEAVEFNSGVLELTARDPMLDMFSEPVSEDDEIYDALDEDEV